MKIKLVNKVLIVMILCFYIIILGFRNDNKNLERRSLFSWSDSEVTEGYTDLFKTMEKLDINTLYQEFSEDLKIEDIEKFLLYAEDKKIDVSLLSGSPKWALDRNGKSMVRTVDRVIEINQSLDKSNGIKSIVFDVEPYILEEWNEENSKRIMDDFVRGMKIAYKKAKQNNLEVTICIPFYYDNMGFSKQLKDLIKSGCDSVAIMNYFKTNEAKNIRQEVEYADRYGKKVINIYELQAPGKHGLEDKNTYYKEGIVAVEKSFSKIKKELYSKDISIAFHEYRVLKEILERK